MRYTDVYGLGGNLPPVIRQHNKKRAYPDEKVSQRKDKNLTQNFRPNGHHSVDLNFSLSSGHH
jgi:hypothetical protein